ncbi:MAG: TrbG/VirB9 family P-type conjugative transfer protein [Sphingomonas sp.]|nr:TrbG/VirB9 family P-type conjugative transfer protein [Sphingomonas sp.]
MTKIPAAFLALALFTSPALAATDGRLQTVHYEADKVVPVKGRLGFQSMIEFGQGESIENVAVGDSAAWQVTPNKRANLLFLKPLFGKAKTNMTVVTDQHVYLFDLSVAPAGNTPLYNMRFTYGVAPAAPPPAAPLQRRIAYPSLLANASAAAPTVSHPKLNYDWKRKGDKELLPARYYDDGRSLYLQWKPGIPMPALFERDAKGMDGLVNYRLQGSFIVVDEVPATLVMRLGKKSAMLINRHHRNEQPVRIAER